MHTLALVNPRRKRRHKKSRARSHSRKRRHVRRHRARRRSVIVVGRRVNPRRTHRIVHRKRRFHRRRNPRLSLGGLTRQLIPAVMGGAGAVAVDIGVGYLSGVAAVPDFFKSGYGKVALQVGAAFGMGYVTRKVLKKPDLANNVVLGALTVAAYGLVKNLVKQAAPTVPGLAGNFADNIGAYLPPSLGYTNPAPMVSGVGEFGAYMPGMGEYGMSDGM